MLLAPEIGVYAAPIGMIVGFGIPALLLFIRGQRGKKPLYFPYREVGTALLLAALIAGGVRAAAGDQPLSSSCVIAVVADRGSGSCCWRRCARSRPRTGSR